MTSPSLRESLAEWTDIDVIQHQLATASLARTNLSMTQKLSTGLKTQWATRLRVLSSRWLGLACLRRNPMTKLCFVGTPLTKASRQTRNLKPRRACQCAARTWCLRFARPVPVIHVRVKLLSRLVAVEA
jgi:hypothetical protein